MRAVESGADTFRWSTASTVKKRWAGKNLGGTINQYDVDYPRVVKSVLQSEYGVRVDLVEKNGFWEFKIPDEVIKRIKDPQGKPPYLYAVPSVAGAAMEKPSEEKQPKKLDPGIYVDEDTGKYFRIDKDGNMEPLDDETP